MTRGSEEHHLKNNREYYLKVRKLRLAKYNDFMRLTLRKTKIEDIIIDKLDYVIFPDSDYPRYHSYYAKKLMVWLKRVNEKVYIGYQNKIDLAIFDA